LWEKEDSRSFGKILNFVACYVDKVIRVNISWHVGYYVCYFYVQAALNGDGRMGTSSSRHGDLASNEYLEKFASKEPISSNEPFWNRFLSFSFTPPATRYRYEFCVLLL